MTTPKRHEQLDELVRLARQEPTPELDWEAVSSRVFERIEASEPARRRTHVKAYAAGAGLLAAAAGIILVLGLQSDREGLDATPVDEASAVSNSAALHSPSAQRADAVVVIGSNLRLGESVSSQAEPKVVRHGGRIVWTLAPYGKATLVSSGRYLTLQLHKGEITAEVTPGLDESFAIEVGETRVAVRGTRFSVKRSGGNAQVAVERGTVVVGGRASPGETQGIELTAPAIHHFEIIERADKTAGVHASKEVDVSPELRQPALASEADTRSESAASGGASAQKSQLTIEEVERVLEPFYAQAQSCLTRHSSAPAGNVAVTVRTKLSLSLSPDGRVSLAAFDPPLAPAIEACVEQKTEALRFPSEDQAATVSRVLELKR